MARHPQIDPARLGHVGVSHAGEMLFKIASQYDSPLRAGIACEPANHEFLDLTPDDTAFTNPDTHLRNIEEMQMRDPAFVRSRINEPLALERIAPISIPLLVMGRDDDHLQGIFRLSYDLLAASGKDAAWVTWDHPLHGYIFPVVGADGVVEVDDVQEPRSTVSSNSSTSISTAGLEGGRLLGWFRPRRSRGLESAPIPYPTRPTWR